MLPLTKILCPTDFSNPSFEALEAVNQLVLQCCAKLIVVHVVKPIDSMPIVSPSATAHISLYRENTGAVAGRTLNEVIHQKVPKEIMARSSTGVQLMKL